ncbi:alpha-ketoglutarate-dependent dioxygenase AlkB [Mangrovimicrobium sediminis]|uniref:Alpha-ketoglutarate-dependent dioxygenase AlkB n=1 Tax=Mangrovimicrobium sediminis TaxID=2562682 RepID=A0A4Z0M310_9GAMM|nr:alpha-ketoglutarate-dependent dioxygenase AlkB [Haliea sp. SAOS-164]
MPGCPALSLLRGFLDDATSDSLYRRLRQEQAWPDNHYEVFGRRFTLPRLQTWHADAGIVYSYSDNLLVTRPWSALLSDLRQRVQGRLGAAFNAVLVNYYRDGDDYVGWHSDDERELGAQPLIASLSLGAPREFQFRRKGEGAAAGSVLLESGSLLVMEPAFQHDWQHCVPRVAAGEGRINLTFRLVLPPLVQG